jgi:hypothetical protein
MGVRLAAKNTFFQCHQLQIDIAFCF